MPQTTKRLSHSLIITVSAAFILTALGIYSVNRYRPQPIKIADVVPKPVKMKIESGSTMFSTAVFLNRNKTFVSLPYILGNPPQTLWLTLQTPAGTPTITRLIYHPTLANLSWNYLEDNGLRLYQKSPTYRSVADFLKNPPSKKVILADEHLLSLPEYKKLKALPLPDMSEQIDLNQVDYFLTTYTESRHDNDFSYYETTLDASAAYVSQDNKLNWLIKTIGVNSDNPFYLGDIHVDYRQF